MDIQKKGDKFEFNKFKFTLTGAIVFLGIAVLVGSCQISSAIKYHGNQIPNYQNEFNEIDNHLEEIIKSNQ